MFFIYWLFSVIFEIENQILKFPWQKTTQKINSYLNIQNIKIRYLNKTYRNEFQAFN